MHEILDSDPLLPWELLDRYYSGEATPAEAELVEAHFADRPDVAGIINQLVDTIHESVPQQTTNTATMLAAAHDRMLPHTALRQVVRTFFGGSFGRAVAALLDVSRTELTDAELADLRRSISKTKREGR